MRQFSLDTVESSSSFLFKCFIVELLQTSFAKTDIPTFTSDIYKVHSGKTTTVLNITEESAELNEFITKYLVYVILCIISLVIFVLVILQCKKSKSANTVNTNRMRQGKQDHRLESSIEFQHGTQTPYETIPETIRAAHYHTLTDNYDEINEHEQLSITVPHPSNTSDHIGRAGIST